MCQTHCVFELCDGSCVYLFIFFTVREINLQDIKEDLDLDPEENSTLFMGILIKGLAKLKKIPETVKAIKERLEQELQQIVKRSTTQVADSSYQRGENLTADNQPRWVGCSSCV